MIPISIILSDFLSRHSLLFLQDDHRSSLKSIINDVSQILNHLLFIFFINDFFLLHYLSTLMLSIISYSNSYFTVHFSFHIVRKFNIEQTTHARRVINIGVTDFQPFLYFSLELKEHDWFQLLKKLRSFIILHNI